MHYVHRLNKKNTERLAGVFVLSILGILIAVFLFIGSQQRFFSEKYTLKTVLNEGYGLKPGVPVNLAGIEVGKIESIDFNDENKIEVVLSIQKSFQERIREDSVITVVSLGLMGSKMLEISLGSVSKPVIKDGGTIKSSATLEFDNIIAGVNPLLIKATRALDRVFLLSKNLNTSFDRIDNVFKTLDEMIAEVKEGKGSLGGLLRDERFYSDLVNLINSGQELISDLKDTLSDVKVTSGELPGLIEKSEITISEFNEGIQGLPELISKGTAVINDISKITGELSKFISKDKSEITTIKGVLKDIKDVSADIPKLIRSAQENVDETARIIDGAKKNWIIKGFLKKEKRDTAIIIDERDSHY